MPGKMSIDENNFLLILKPNELQPNLILFLVFINISIFLWRCQMTELKTLVPGRYQNVKYTEP